MDKDISAAGIIYLRTACNSAFHLKRFSFIYSPVWLSYKTDIIYHPWNKHFHGVDETYILHGDSRCTAQNKQINNSI